MIAAVLIALMAGQSDPAPVKPPPKKVAAKPVLYVVGAPWCGPCKSLDALLAAADLSAFRVEHVNGDVDLALRLRLGIDRYPTMVIADEKGNEVGRRTGLISAAELAAFLKRPGTPDVAPEPIPDPAPRAKQPDPATPSAGMTAPKGFSWRYLPGIGWGWVDDKIPEPPPPLPATGNEPVPPKKPKTSTPYPDRS